MRSRLPVLLVTSVTLGTASMAAADPEAGAAPAATASAAAAHAAAPAKPKGKAKGKARRHSAAAVNTTGPVATFPGFRILENGMSRVYVDLTGSVPVEEHAAQGSLTYVLKGARVLSRNNRNPLITTHFSSPVARARLVPAGGDLELVIDLRGATTPAHRIVADAGGKARLEVDFPAGNFPLEPGRYLPSSVPHGFHSREDDAPPDIPRQENVQGDGDDNSGVGPKAP
jgi:hypothetical protein